MKKLVVCLVMTLVLSMIGAIDVYAIDFTENLSISIGELAILLVLHLIFLFIGAKIAGVEHETFGQVIWATLGVAVLFFFMLVLTSGKDLETLGLFVVGILSIVLIQRIFNTTLLKALGTFLFTLVGNVIAIFVVPGIV